MAIATQSQVVRALIGLADTPVENYDVYDLLQRLVDECTRLLDITAAGLLLAGQGGTLQVAAASSERMRDLEVLQLQVDRGPCLEAYSSGEAVIAGDPGELARRWSDFAADVASAGFVSVAAVPLRLRGRTLGVMGMFSEHVNLPGPEDLETAQGLADMATIALLHHRTVDDSHALSAQLQQALDSRVLIEQAKGVVASQLGIGVSDAFTVIRDHARAGQLSLRHVAQALVEGRTVAGDLHPPTRNAGRGRR